MAENTAIEWTDATWNPITGCTLVSEGCRHCYAARLAATRMRNEPSRKGLARINAAGEAKFTGEVRFNEKWLDQPLRWRRPRMIFVCAHGDLFHESVPDEWIDRVFAVMALAPRHTFQVLTKRPERARAYLSKLSDEPSEWRCKRLDYARLTVWPLPNVWLGTSVEDQATADARIPHLLATPAAVRFVSAEPLLGPVDLTRVGDLSSVRSAFPALVRDLEGDMGPSRLTGVQMEAVGTRWQGKTYYQTHDHMGGFEVGSRRYPCIDWVIVGGESGPGARPMHPDWARSLRDQCQAAGVAFFFKQWGAWAPWDDDNWSLPDGCDDVQAHDRSVMVDGVEFLCVGKKRAGRMLDGRTWDQFPDGAP